MSKISFKSILLFFVGLISCIDLNAQEYCTVSATTTGNEYISEFKFSNVTNTTGDNGYTNYSSTHSIVIYPGAVYKPEATLKKSYSSDALCCWIDWNHNKVFESGEKYTFVVQTGVGTANITVPQNATLGKTRLRLMLRGGGTPDPCASYRYGEVEDYEIDLQQVSFPPVADFKADIVKPFVGQQVTFTDLSTALPTSWLWEITPSTFEFVNSSETSQNPIVKFNHSGLYTIKLKSTNDFGFDDTTKVEFINVCNFPVARNLDAKTEGSWVDLSWIGPNIEGWKCYIDNQSTTMLMWETPERATLFRAKDFNLYYPVTVSKIEHSFFEHNSYLWPSDGFKYKIYDEDGTTVLFESETLHALKTGVTGYNLSTPLILNKDFYVSICPIDASGHPSSTMKDVIGADTHTYLKKDGWQLMKEGSTGYEIQTSIYVLASKGATTLSYVKQGLQKAEVQTSLLTNTGYNIYRDNNLIKTLNSATSLSYRDSLVTDGDHTYYVTAKYQSPTGESLASNVKQVTVNNTTPEIQAEIAGNHFESGATYFIPQNVMVNEAYNISIVINNSGNSQPLDISNVTIDNSEFVITQALPSQIPAGSSSTLIIKFTPTSEGDKIGNLSIGTNDSNENPFTIKLTAVAGPVEWTWMVYMLEDNTQLDGEKDVNEWEINGSIPGKVNYLVFWDAQDDEKDGIWYVKKDPTGKLNYELYSDKVSTEFGEDFDMSNYQTLKNFLLWTAQKYPAKHYGLAMWDHGSGIFKKSIVEKGVTKDFCGGMKLWDMEKAVSAFTTQVGKKIDIIGFDVCLLGQIETAYQLAPYCDYVIASPKTEPGDGWDYDAAFRPLNENYKLDVSELAKSIVYTYIAAYTPGGSSYPAVSTQAATSTDKLIQNVIPSFNTFATELKNWAYFFKPQIKTARDNAWVAPGTQGPDNPDHRDLMGFAKGLMNDYSLPSSLRKASEDLVKKLGEAIIANANYGSTAAGSNGLKIFIPNDISTQGTSQTFYMDPVHYLKFSNTTWDEFLYMFASPSAINQPNFVQPSNLTAQVVDGNDVTLNWVQPYNDSQENTLLIQGFEGSTWPPVGWEVLHSTNIDGTGLSAPAGATWVHCSSATFATDPNPNQYMHSGTYSAAIGYTAPDFNWLISPTVTIDEGYNLYFWIWYANDDQYYTKFHVKVLSDGIWSNMLSYDSNSLTNTYSSEVMVDLSAYVGRSVRIAFVYEYTDGYQLSLDDIRIAKATTKGGDNQSPINTPIVKRSKVINSTISYASDTKGSSNFMGVLNSFKIYRNGVLVNTIDDGSITTWKDVDLPSGSYNYEVSAIYKTPTGESVKCGPASVMINQTDVETDNITVKAYVYPNPSNGNFIIKTEGLKEFNWTLFSLDGVKLKEGISKSESLRLEGLKTGIYFLKLKSANFDKTIKVIIV